MNAPETEPETKSARWGSKRGTEGGLEGRLIIRQLSDVQPILYGRTEDEATTHRALRVTLSLLPNLASSYLPSFLLFFLHTESSRNFFVLFAISSVSYLLEIAKSIAT